MKYLPTRRWVIFILGTLLYVISQFYRVSMTVITSDLVTDLSLSPQQLGTCSAIFFYGFALTQIPIILYLDRIGPRVCMTVLTVFGIGGTVLFATAQSINGLLLGRMLMGIGMACNLMGSFKLVTQWFSPARFATLTTLIASIGTVGNLLAATPLVYLVQMTGWRAAFMLCALFNLLLVTVFCLVVRNHPEGDESPSMTDSVQSQSAPLLSGAVQLFRLKDYWMISLGTFCRYGAFAAVQALWAGPYLMTVMGYSVVTTGHLVLLLNIGFIVGGPIFGALSDRLIRSRKIVVVLGLAGFAVSLAILVGLPPRTSIIVIALVFSTIGLFSSAGTIMYPHIIELMPPQLSGTATTGINLFSMAGAAVFLQGLGVLMQWLATQTPLASVRFGLCFGLCSVLLGLTACLYTIGTKETLSSP